jgi:hypothetical protein
MKMRFLKYTSFLMVIVVFTISAAGFCRSAHAAELSVDAVSPHGVSYLSAIEKGCPYCPVDEHSVPDHCDSSCHCPCHASLTAQPVQIVCSQQISPLVFPEPFKFLPEVYLSKFIPPQNLA